MASNNRAALINKALKVVKKHYKPSESAQERTLLEHLLYACCLENSLPEDADKVFETLSQDFYDWNEVRVTTIRELAVIMKPLNDPEGSAKRLKRVLQSVFETHYSYDLELLKKQNIGLTVKQIEKYKGSTGFIVSYVTQNALSGHSIPINRGLLVSMKAVGIISDAEAAKGRVPGLERIVPKTKGVEVGTLLHQLGVELFRSPYGQTIRKLLLEIDPNCKDRLPKRPTKKVKAPEPKAPKKAEPAKKTESKGKAKPEADQKQEKETAKKKVAAKKKEATSVAKAKDAKTKATKTKAKAAKKTPTKKAPAKKKVATKKKVVKKKVAKKAPAKKKAATKKKAKSATKKTTKRKPR